MGRKKILVKESSRKKSIQRKAVKFKGNNGNLKDTFRLRNSKNSGFVFYIRPHCIDMCSVDVNESSGELLKEDMLCAYLNDGREIKSRGLIKKHLPVFLPRMAHISSSDHLHTGEQDSSCWISAGLLPVKCRSQQQPNSSCIKKAKTSKTGCHTCCAFNSSQSSSGAILH